MPTPTPLPSTASRRATSRFVLVAFVCAVVMVAATFPAVAQEEDARLRSELEQVEAQQQRLSESLTQATQRVDDLTERLSQVRDRSAALRQELDELERRGNTAGRLMTSRVRAMYKGDRVNGLMAFATGESLLQMGQRSHYLTAMTRGDRQEFETAAALSAAAQARRAELAEVDQDLDALVAQADAAREELDEQFVAAAATQEQLRTELARREAEAKRLAAEAARERLAAQQAAAGDAQLAQADAAERRAAAASRSADRVRQQVQSAPPPQAAAASSGGKACPQDNPRSFTDTWGAARSGGRSHQGTDIFGTRGGRVFAIVSGTVEWTQNGAMSGLFLSLRGDDGNTYWYLHLQDFVARAGQRVSAGELIAHNGDSGNARGTGTHIHFEVHPGGGAAVNPYPLLRSVCG